MRTRKCAILIGSCILVLFFALLLMEWYFLIFVIPLVFLLSSGVLFFYNKKFDVEIVRSLSNIRIFEDETVDVSIQIKNNGESISFLEIYDELPDKVTVEKNTNYLFMSLGKNETFSYTYRLKCPLRGQFQIGPLHFRMKDSFGLFFREETVESSDELTVIPQIEDIRDIAIRAKANPYPGLMQTNQTGIGMEFFGIRKYVSGDSFKRVNWKSLARWNSLMVNQYEFESTTDVIILIDARRNQQEGSLSKNPLEYGIRAAVAFASHFLKRRDRVGLLVYGKEDGSLKWVYPESGKKQLYKIIREIVAIQATDESFCDAAVNRAITYMIPKKSLVILISSLQNDASIPEAVQHLIARNFGVIVLSPSPVAIKRMLPNQDIYSELANTISSLERSVVLRNIREAGGRVVDWDPAVPLAASLQEVERSRVQR